MILKDTTESLARAEKDLKAFDELRTWLRIALGIQNIYDNIHRVEEKIPTALPTGSQLPTESTIGLQKVVTVVDLEEVKKQAPKVPTDSVKGKILALARDGFFNNWQSVGDISTKLVDVYRFNTSEQAINGTLKDLVEEHILGMKHTDRNRWKMAPDVLFEGKKEAKN